MSENQYDRLEQRLDLITAENTYFREQVSALQKEISATRVEFLTLRNQVNRTHEQPSAVNFSSRVYRPPPIGLPRPDLRSNTPVCSLPVAVPVARAEAPPPSLLPPPEPILPAPPVAPIQEEDNTCSEVTSAVSSRSSVPIRSIIARVSTTGEISSQTSSHSSLSHRFLTSSPPVGSLVEVIRGKHKGRYRNKTFRVEGNKGSTYIWIRETGLVDAERLYKANSSLQVLDTRTV